MSIKLVNFEIPIWATCQGEGVLVGVPSTFVRLYGCDYQCPWCDTKGSWAKGTSGSEYPIETVVEAVVKHKLNNVVITGGNPFLQASEVVKLIIELRKQMGQVHVTTETQGSVFDRVLTAFSDLLSLSPKLHALPDVSSDVLRKTPLWDFLRFQDKRIGGKSQVKIVTTSKEDVHKAIALFDSITHDFPGMSNDVTYLIQPEYSLGRQNVTTAIEEILTEHSKGARLRYPNPIRILPQMHKTSLFVR